jgi:WD40 repeat protein
MHFFDVVVDRTCGDVSALYSYLQHKIRSKWHFSATAVASTHGLFVYTNNYRFDINKYGPIHTAHFIDVETIAFPNVNAIIIYDIKTMKKVCSLEGHTSLIITLEHEKRTLFSSSLDKSVRAWNLDTKCEKWCKLLTTFTGYLKITSNNTLAISNFCSVLLLNTEDCSIIKEVGFASMMTKIVTSASFICIQSHDRVVVRDKKLDEVSTILCGFTSSITMVADDKIAVVHKNLRVYNVRTGEKLSKYDNVATQLVEYTGVPDLIATGNKKGKLKYFNLKTHQSQLIDHLRCKIYAINCI